MLDSRLTSFIKMFLFTGIPKVSFVIFCVLTAVIEPFPFRFRTLQSGRTLPACFGSVLLKPDNVARASLHEKLKRVINLRIPRKPLLAILCVVGFSCLFQHLQIHQYLEHFCYFHLIQVIEKSDLY